MDIASLMPEDTPDYMLPAWIGCIHWAISEPDVIHAFEAETGMRYAPPKSAIDHAVDQASGYSEGFIRRLIEWVNVNVWGPMDGEPLGTELGRIWDANVDKLYES